MGIFDLLSNGSGCGRKNGIQTTFIGIRGIFGEILPIGIGQFCLDLKSITHFTGTGISQHRFGHPADEQIAAQFFQQQGMNTVRLFSESGKKEIRSRGFACGLQKFRKTHGNHIQKLYAPYRE